jgi:hypothetical protein
MAQSPVWAKNVLKCLYSEESAHHSATLTPFCVDSIGSFAPRDPIFNAGGRLDPTPIINAVFRNGKAASKEGRIPLLVVEGFLRILAGWLHA